MQAVNTQRPLGDSLSIQGLRGLCAGSHILTLEGELPIEYLNAGDQIITRDSGATVLRGLQTFRITAAPLRIKVGSLGHTRPDRDSICLPDCAIHIRDWRAQVLFGTKDAKVPASRLIDGEFIAPMQMREMQVIRLIFDHPHILYVDGLEIWSD